MQRCADSNSVVYQERTLLLQASPIYMLTAHSYMKHAAYEPSTMRTVALPKCRLYRGLPRHLLSILAACVVPEITFRGTHILRVTRGWQLINLRPFAAIYYSISTSPVYARIPWPSYRRWLTIIGAERDLTAEADAGDIDTVE